MKTKPHAAVPSGAPTGPLRVRGWAALIVGVFVALLLYLFYQPLFSEQWLFSPDSPPFYPKNFGTFLWHTYWGFWSPESLGLGYGGSPVYPSQMLGIILPPLVYHVAAYLFDLVLMFLAAIYYLKGRRIGTLPALVTSLAVTFMGYYFTLISAGHRGVFDMMPFAVLMFGLIDRAVSRRSWFHFALAGACYAFGSGAQPDVMLIMALAMGAYALLCVVREWPRGGGGRFLGRVVLGGALSALVFMCVGMSSIGFFWRVTVPQREQQRGKTAEEQWEFATNWSLPPEDIAEFVAPCLRGIETGDPNGPYWGRLGRTLGWEAHRQGLRNLRQHTVYVGVLQLLFAAYAVAWVLGRRDCAYDPGALGDAASLAQRRLDVLFWLGVAIVALLLVLGRYAPFYRAFYALPVVSKIRCPVKFLHLMTLAVCFLFGYGLDLFRFNLSGRAAAGNKGATPSRLALVLGLASWGCAAICIVVLMAIDGHGESLKAGWVAQGYGMYTENMLRTLRGGVGHAALLFFIGGGIFAGERFLRRTPKSACLAISAVAVILAFDTGSVCRKYVRVLDLTPFYAHNPIADTILADPGMGRTSYWLSPRSKTDVLWNNFNHHLVPITEPRQDRTLPADYTRFFEALQRNPTRLWQLTASRFVVGAARQMASLAKQPDFNTVQTFDVNGRGRIVLRNDGGGQGVLLRFDGALPRAQMFYRWRTIAPDAALAMLASPVWDPSQEVLVSGDLPAQDVDMPGEPVGDLYLGGNRAEFNVETQHDGLLLLNDAYDPDWRVTVDGRPATLLRCNFLMRGVAVPAGRHRVVFTYRPYLAPFLASLGGCAALLAWGVLRAAGGRKAQAT